MGIEISKGQGSTDESGREWQKRPAERAEQISALFFCDVAPTL